MNKFNISVDPSRVPPGISNSGFSSQPSLSSSNWQSYNNSLVHTAEIFEAAQALSQPLRSLASSERSGLQSVSASPQSSSNVSETSKRIMAVPRSPAMSSSSLPDIATIAAAAQAIPISATASNSRAQDAAAMRRDKKARKKTKRRSPESRLLEKKKFESAMKEGRMPSAKNVTHRVKDSMWNVYAKVDSNTRIHVADFPAFDQFPIAEALGKEVQACLDRRDAEIEDAKKRANERCIVAIRALQHQRELEELMEENDDSD